MSAIVRFCFPRCTAFNRFGMAIAARIPIMAIAIRSSIRVKPFCLRIKKTVPTRGRDRSSLSSLLLLGPFGPLDEGAIHVPDVVVEVGRRAAHERRERAVAAARLDAGVIQSRIRRVLVKPAPTVGLRGLSDVGRA